MNLTVTDDNIESIDRLDTAARGDASLEVRVEEAPREVMDAILSKVLRHGDRLRDLALHFDLSTSDAPDLSGVSWEKTFPEIRHLSLQSVRISGALFAHTRLQSLSLRACTVDATSAMRIGTEPPRSALQAVDISECAVLPDLFHFGAYSSIETVRCFVDEDCVDQPPEKFVFLDTEALREIDIRICGGWDLELRGCLPALEHVELSGGPYGHFELENRCAQGSSAYAMALTSEAAASEE